MPGCAKRAGEKVVTLTYGMSEVLTIDGMIMAKWITIGEALQSLCNHLAEGNKRIHILRFPSRVWSDGTSMRNILIPRGTLPKHAPARLHSGHQTVSDT
jgi:hypothetical protein